MSPIIPALLIAAAAAAVMSAEAATKRSVSRLSVEHADDGFVIAAVTPLTDIRAALVPLGAGIAFDQRLLSDLPDIRRGATRHAKD